MLILDSQEGGQGEGSRLTFRLIHGSKYWELLSAKHSENEDHGIGSHHFMGNRWGNSQTVSDYGGKSMIK